MDCRSVILGKSFVYPVNRLPHCGGLNQIGVDKVIVLCKYVAPLIESK